MGKLKLTTTEKVLATLLLVVIAFTVGSVTFRIPTGDGGIAIISQTPADISYVQGSTGHTLIWKVSEAVSYSITRSGTQTRAGSTAGAATITENVDNLAIGKWTYTLSVATVAYDIRSYDDAIVTVIEPIDTTPPAFLSTPADQSYSGTVQGLLVWKGTDAHPSGYTITVRSGMSIRDTKTGTWTMANGGYIDYYVTSMVFFAPATYTVTCEIRDVIGNKALDEATVIVTEVEAPPPPPPPPPTDTTPPTISHPSDLTYLFDSTGNAIVWVAEDENPSSYQITATGLPITVVSAGAWTTSTELSYNVDGLNLGSYAFTCTVADSAGNQATDSVTVTVQTPPSDLPRDPQPTLTFFDSKGQAVELNGNFMGTITIRITVNNTVVQIGNAKATLAGISLKLYQKVGGVFSADPAQTVQGVKSNEKSYTITWDSTDVTKIDPNLIAKVVILSSWDTGDTVVFGTYYLSFRTQVGITAGTVTDIDTAILPPPLIEEPTLDYVSIMVVIAIGLGILILISRRKK